MKSSLWTPYISDQVIHAICWTLIHSLWIGLAIALLSGLVITITRKSAAGLRYNLLCGVLILFIISVSATFCLEMWAPSIGEAVFYTREVIHAPGNLILIAPATPHISLAGRVVILLNDYSNILFMVWLLFFVIKSMKMAGGLLYIQRIRNYRVHEVSKEFKHKIEVFAVQIGIRQVVRLVQSELVKVPVAVGWLKPVILLPMGIILQLSPEQLESILWHELAHIRRRDYLVNILQGLAETVFFFNPGLLWLSSLIRAEREACCDDIVLSRMKRKANYLEALLSVGYRDNSKVSLAMSIGSGNQLRDRLKRMVDQENKRLSVAEKVVLAAGLVLLSAFTTISKDNPVIKNLMVKFTNKSGGKAAAQNLTVSVRRLPESPNANDSKPGAAEKRIVFAADTSLRFTSLLFKNSDADPTNNDIRAMDEEGNKYHFIVADNKIGSMEINGKKVTENKLPEYNYMLRIIEEELAQKKRLRNQNIARLDKLDAARDTDAKALLFYKDSVKFKREASQKSPAAKPFSNMSPELYAAKFAAMQNRFHQDSIGYAAERDRAFNVIADLVDDRVAPEPAAVKWFGLSSTEFIVNGMKQPFELQQKYMVKYGVRPGNGLYYGPVQMHGVGVFIDAADSRPPLPPGKPRTPKMQREQKSGYMQPKDVDTGAWKLRQLIKQQDAFAADQNKSRRQLIKEQQVFASIQAKQRPEITQEQKLFSLDQAMKRKQLLQQQKPLSAGQQIQMQQKWRKDDRWAKRDIDMQSAITSIISDLVGAKVLNDKSDLVKFNLTNAALMVNGKKQSEELHQILKDKYLQHPNYQLTPGITNSPNFGLHFNAQNGGMGLGITDGPDSP